MKTKLFSTKKQRDDLLNCHEGVGILIFKLNDDTIREIDVVVRDGVLMILETGKKLVETDLI